MTTKLERVKYPIPDVAERRLVALYESDRDSDGKPQLPETDDAAARDWLMDVLLDPLLLFGHTDVLTRCYGGRFRRARFRDDWPDWGVRPVGPPADPLFRHHELLPDDKAEAIAQRGIGADVLPADALARLLLNPYALWDLADLILFRVSEWWDEPIRARGEKHMAEAGFELPMPKPRGITPPDAPAVPG